MAWGGDGGLVLSYWQFPLPPMSIYLETPNDSLAPSYVLTRCGGAAGMRGCGGLCQAFRP